MLRPRAFFAALLLAAVGAFPCVRAAESASGVAWVRQVPAINGGGTVEGDIQVMNGGPIVLNGGATITRDLLVPGTPEVRINGKPNYGGTLDGSGPATPANYTVTLNGQATLRNVIRRTAPLVLPAVSAPPAPAGTRAVTLDSAAQPVGDWATLRNLTLNGNVGQIAVPPGTYGDFVANGGSGFTLGISGATTPAVYNLRRLTMSGQARIDVAGPVVLKLANGLAANGAIGSPARPDWLALNIASGGLTLNGGCTVFAYVAAPAPAAGSVIINGNATLVGGLVADQLVVNGGGLLRLRQSGGTGPANTAPVANSQALSTPEDVALALTLTASDAENDALSYQLVSVPAQGALTYAAGAAVPAPGAVLASTTLRYTPAADFNGVDSFTFRVRDAAGLESNLATVSISVTPVNDLPVATPLAVDTLEDTPVAITLSGRDPEGFTLTYAVVAGPARGSLTGEPPALTYRPHADSSGADSFTYTVTDAAGGVSAPAVVAISVAPVNDAPVAQPQAIELREDEPVLLAFAATDAEGQPLAYALAELPAHGTLTLADGSPVPDVGQPLPASAGAVLRYVPGANFHGADAFAFTASDGALPSAPAAIHLTVMPVNDTPAAALLRPSAGEDFVAPARVTVQASVADADGENDIVRVVFRVDGQAVGEVSAAPWSFVWEAAQPGSWEIDAVVYDRAGAGGVSPRMTVSVAAPPPPSFARVELALPPSPAVEISARPALGLVPFESVVSWSAASAAAVAVSGPGFADQASSGSSVRSFSSVGAYEFAVSASAPRVAHLSWSVADATSVRLIDPAGVEQDVTGSTERDVSMEGVWRLIATNAVGVSAQAERVMAWPPDARRTVTVVAKAAPRVALVAPGQGAQLPVSSPLVLEAAPTDDDGSDDIARVEFFAGDTKLGSVEGAPWRFVWPAPAVGELLLRAEVEDRSGARGVSSPVSVRVLAAPAVISAFSAEAPAAPAAEISADPRTGSAPLTSTIAWRATDASSVEVRGAGVAADGLTGTAATTLEAPGSYVYAVTAQPLRAARLTWQVSGAGELFLRDPSGRQIGVSGLGEYQATAAGVWRLVARNADGVETVSEPLELAWPAAAVAQVEVTVNTPPRRPLAVDVGADRLVSLPTTVALSATVLDAGQTPPSGSLAYAWSFATLGGSGTATISPADGATPTVAFSAPGLYRLTLSVETSDKLAAGEDSLLVQVQPAPVIADTGASGSVGYDYWLTFLRNFSPRFFYFEKVRNELIITATEEAEGTITQYVPEFGWQGVQTGQVESVIYFKVSPGQPYRFLPDAFNAKAGEPQDKVEAIFRPGVARKAAIRVRSDKPVEIHGLSAETYSADGFRAFPANLLGKEYILAGFDDFKLSGDPGTRGTFAIVATRDGTLCKISPASNLIGRDGVPIYDDFEVRLNAGEVVWYDSTGGDITGTFVDADKPVAVFSGSSCTNIPADQASCDILIEQMLPVTVWGRNYVVTPLRETPEHLPGEVTYEEHQPDGTTSNVTKPFVFAGDLVRVVAARDGTSLSLNGEIVASLDRGEFYQAVLTGPGTFVASGPVQVAQYMPGSQFRASLPSGNGEPQIRGDPLMLMVPAVEHWGRDLQFFAFDRDYATGTAAGPFLHFLNLVTLNRDAGELRLDGVAFDPAGFEPVAGTEFLREGLEISPGYHHVRSDRPFMGIGWGVFWAESYGFTSAINVATPPVPLTFAPDSLPSAALVGARLEPMLRVTDENGGPVGGIGVEFEVSGVHATSLSVLSDAQGWARIAYEGVAAGLDTIRARCAGQEFTWTVTWREASAAGNQAPRVSLDGVRELDVGDVLTLDAQVTDDGLGGVAPPALTWKSLGGFGGVVIRQNGASAVFEFPLPGKYLVRATAVDGELSSSDEAWITVRRTSSVRIVSPISDLYYDIDDINWRGLTVQAEAASHQAIQGVEFFLDGTLVETRDINAPYTCRPYFAEEGEHRIVARMYLPDGSHLDSDPVVVHTLRPPQVEMVAPNAPVSEPTPVEVELAISGGRAPYYVEIIQGDGVDGPVIASFFDGPYKFTWSDAYDLPWQERNLTVLVVDSAGLVRTTPLWVGELVVPKLTASYVSHDPAVPVVLAAGQPLTLRIRAEGIDAGLGWAWIEGGSRYGYSDSVVAVGPRTFDYTVRIDDFPVGEHTLTGDIFTSYGSVPLPGLTLRVVDDLPNTPPELAAEYPPSSSMAAESGVASVSVRAFSADADGDAVTVEFYRKNAGGAFDLAYSQAAAGQPVEWRLTDLSVGAYEIQVIARDGRGAVKELPSYVFTVAPFSTEPPTEEFAIETPGMDETVTKPTEIQGYARLPGMGAYRLEARAQAAAGEAPSAWVTIHRGDGPIGSATGAAALGLFDPGLLRNGAHELRLAAEMTDGSERYSPVVRLLVDGKRKIGAFSVAFRDLSLPLAGLPLDITRSYDSRDRLRAGDFGYGWSLAVNSVSLRKNRPLGDGWHQEEEGFSILGSEIKRYTVDSDFAAGGSARLKHLVTLRFPDDSLATFRMELQAAGGGVGFLGIPVEANQRLVSPIAQVNVVFAPANARTRGSLQIEGSSTAYLPDFAVSGPGSTVLRAEADPFAPVFNPTRFRYTTEDGTVYLLDSETGLESVTDRVGNRLELERDSASGRITQIRHSSGQAVVFHRDAAGRIEYLEDPYGAQIDYVYDGAGDLVAVTDRAEATTSYAYYTGSADPGEAHLAHVLKTIHDPSGTQVLRNEYDEQGRLIRQFDAAGRPVEFIRDQLNQEKVRDRLGYTTTYEYDDEGNVIAVFDKRGYGTWYKYEDPSNPYSVTREEGSGLRVVYRTYDDAGRLLSERRSVPVENGSVDATTRTTYDSLGNPLTQTDASGRVTATAYDVSGLPATLTDALGQVTRFTAYDSHGNITRMVDPAGCVVLSEYDAQDRLLWQMDASGVRTDYAYDTLGRVKSETRAVTLPDGSARSLVTEYGYDAEGRLTSTLHPDGTTTATEYDLNGRPEKLTDALGRVTVNHYDEQGRLERVDYPPVTLADGGAKSYTEEFIYDAEGRRTHAKDRADRWTRTYYDPEGQVIAQYLLDEAVATRAQALASPVGAGAFQSGAIYDSARRPVAVFDALGNRTQNVYDESGRLLKVIPPGLTPARVSVHWKGDSLSVDNLQSGSGDEDRAVSYSYDPVGNLVKVTDGRGRVTRYAYDALNRRVSTFLPDGTRTSRAYDALGRVIAETDAEGRVTRFRHDALCRLLETRQYLDTALAAGDAGFTASPDAAGVVSTRYGYDELGRQVSQTDAQGRVTRFEYDEMGRRTARILPDGARETVVYDEAGRVESRTDFNGETVEHLYDEHDRLLARIPGAAARARGALKASFTYDATGRRLTQRLYDAADQPVWWENYFYDGQGRLEAKQTPVGILDYARDAQGNLVLLASDRGAEIHYAYDGGNRLVEAEDRRGLAPFVPGRETHYAYDRAGALERVTQPNGVSSLYQYDAAQRLTNIATKLGPATLASFVYELNPGGRRAALEERIGGAQANGAARRTEWGYDALYRLVGESMSGGTGDVAATLGSASYTYDKVGNRRTRSSTNPVLADRRTSYGYNERDWLEGDGYDANGNTLAGQTAGLAASATDRYDDQNRLVQRTESGVGGRTITVLYDADGNRVRKSVTTPGRGTVTTYYVVDTENPAGYVQVIEELAQAGTGSITLSKSYVYGLDLISVADHVDEEVGLRYYGYDGLGSVRYLTSESGAITDRYYYDAFGVLLRHEGPSDNLYLYAGEQWDADLGLYYNRARYLNPDSGRFWSQDSFEGVNAQPQSLHKYLYAHADPVNGIDPSGNFTGSVVELTSTLYVSADMRTTNAVVAGFAQRQAATTIFKIGTRLIVSSVLATATVGTVGAGYAVYSELERADLKRRVKSELDEFEQRNPGQLLYHYTDAAGAQGIAETRRLHATPENYDPRYQNRLPQGGYATDISPLDGYSKSALAQIIYYDAKFAADRVSAGRLDWVVVLLNKRPQSFIPLGAHQYYRPPPADVNVLGVLPNPNK